MATPAHLSPGPYAHDGGRVGVLVIHGFTGAATETRPFGELLARRGLSVRCPLLPGHGTQVDELTRGVRWRDWVDEAEAKLDELRPRCDTIFVAGLSLGSLITLFLGATHPEVRALVAFSPPLRVRSPLVPLTVPLRRVLRYDPFNVTSDDSVDPDAPSRIWCYDRMPLWGAAEVWLFTREVRRVLPRVRQPLLCVQGRQDKLIHERSGREVLDAISSTHKELRFLERSGHNVLCDGEREAAWEQAASFIDAWSKDAT